MNPLDFWEILGVKCKPPQQPSNPFVIGQSRVHIQPKVIDFQSFQQKAKAVPA
jgi:hypothetical protein